MHAPAQRPETDSAAFVAPAADAKNTHRRYDKAFFFRERPYHTMESLVEAFAETEESWKDALLAVSRGYVRKWLESNDDYGRSMELEKHAEESPEEQRFALLLAYASLENPEVLLRLGECYRDGCGTEKDEEAEALRFTESAARGHQVALKIVREAAETGNPLFAFRLGGMYLSGVGVRKDEMSAAKLYAESARKNESRALSALEELAENEALEAMYLLGVMLSEGSSVERDAERAALLCRRAAERGHQEALSEMMNKSESGDAVFAFHLGEMYRNGAGVEKNEGNAAKWWETSAEDGEKRALAALENLAESGFVDAMHVLAGMYFEGRAVSQDDVKASKWYRKAAELGHARAQFNLGWMYQEGRGVSRDEWNAVEWYRKSADQGFSRAQHNLGVRYENGRGVPQDYEKAAEWYEKAAVQGFADAQYKLGVMYENGHGIPQNDELAAEWYKRAAEQGHAIAQFNLGRMYEKGYSVLQDDKLAARLYEKAAEQGNVDAQNSLGTMYENGRGVSQDNGKAVEWYRKAADQESSEAQFNLGVMYADGRGVEKDEDKAMECYRKAGERGNEAIMRLALADYFSEPQFKVYMPDRAKRLLLDGMSHQLDFRDPKSDEKAMECYKKAAQLGQVEAQFRLGLMYRKCRGALRNEKKAAEWFLKAAEQGHAEAQYNLNLMYREGRGVTRDKKIAEEWKRKAAEQGYLVPEQTPGLFEKVTGFFKNK